MEEHHFNRVLGDSDKSIGLRGDGKVYFDGKVVKDINATTLIALSVYNLNETIGAGLVFKPSG